jgi:hypothetical protein
VIHSDQWIGIALYHNGGTRDALLRIKQIGRIDHRRELTSNSGGIVGAVVGVLAALTNPRFRRMETVDRYTSAGPQRRL